MKTTIITPQAFKEAFEQSVHSLNDLPYDRFKDNREFTTLMLGSNPNGGICRDVARRLKLEYYREYWTIDAIYFERKDVKNFGNIATYAEYLSVALEHENDPAKSHQEINKLSLFSTPLKVLITYPRGDFMKLLRLYSNILIKADAFNDFSKLRRQLVIFGFPNKTQLDWKFFVYNNEGFEEI